MKDNTTSVTLIKDQLPDARSTPVRPAPPRPTLYNTNMFSLVRPDLPHDTSELSADKQCTGAADTNTSFRLAFTR
ncbi:hypothetical protein J6590_004700 [Homalodisca vitripennis]|nr:hypothetical protein J6590_004700 [Homalodisca vitripennis]